LCLELVAALCEAVVFGTLGLYSSVDLDMIGTGASAVKAQINIDTDANTVERC